MAPDTIKQWTIAGQNGFDSLKLDDKAQVPKLGSRDVLVKFHAASLNYRDLIIPRGEYPFEISENVVPGSDGAGTVEAVGDSVSRFKPGDKVVTLFTQAHLGGDINPKYMQTALGGVVDGTFRQYGAFSEEGLVHIPKNLDFLEASTLSCAAVTAWNGLYGIQSKALKAGDWVLTQGTGGVSLFAVQFAKAAGAKVVSTTSSAEKAERLKKLGADHIINYKEDSNWGATAKKLTPNEEGFAHIIEVGGPTTVKQSLEAVKIEGVISIIGFVGGQTKDQPSWLEILQNLCTVRGLLVGSRDQFEDMNSAIEVNDLHPVVDDKVFTLEQLKEAYQYMWDQKHFGKLVVKIE